jgi:hypothetical protein
VVPVKNVRGRVSLIERFTISAKPSRLRRWRFSRMRSKTTILSFNE